MQTSTTFVACAMALLACLLINVVTSRSAPEEYSGMSGVAQDASATGSHVSDEDVVRELQYLKEKTAELATLADRLKVVSASRHSDPAHAHNFRGINKRTALHAMLQAYSVDGDIITRRLGQRFSVHEAKIQCRR